MSEIDPKQMTAALEKAGLDPKNDAHRVAFYEAAGEALRTPGKVKLAPADYEQVADRAQAIAQRKAANNQQPASKPAPQGSTPEEQREAMRNHLTTKTSQAVESPEQQQTMREQFLGKLRDYALDPSTGLVKRNVYEQYRDQFSEWGLRDTSLPKNLGKPLELPEEYKGLTPEQQTQLTIAKATGRQTPQTIPNWLRSNRS